ncbi:MAG: hypothetical protein JW932_08085 [Deltaproteobacteria bacterium]|nr:hypothetical protein [Deltaproteobacteria bacterium]
MKKYLYIISLLSVLFIALWLFSCGGGGTSSDEEDNNNNQNNQNQGTPAKIEEDSVQEIMVAVEDLGIGCSMTGGSSKGSSLVRTLTQISQKVADQVQVTYLYSKSREMVDESPEPIEGNCTTNPDGLLIVELWYDEDTGDLDGCIDFDGFCLEVDGSEAIIENGAEFNGNLGLDDDDDLESLTFHFNTDPNGITIDSDDWDAIVTISGLSLNLDEENGGYDIGFTLTAGSVISDDTSVIVSNLSVNVSVDDDDSVTATFSATITTNDGTLSISTPEAIIVNEDGDITGGEIKISGGDNTSVLITYAGTESDPYIFEVKADTDGDGDYEEYCETMDCSDIDIPEDIDDIL